jgi:threonine synthase
MANDGIVLNGWYRWDDAQDLPESRNPGVYLLAHFKTCPRSINTSDAKIIYIGETCGQTLRQRWKQFSNSAFKNKFGHSGGTTYAEKFPGGKRPHLFVAFATPIGEGTARSYHIRYLERKWLHDFVQEHGEPPHCNRK